MALKLLLPLITFCTTFPVRMFAAGENTAGSGYLEYKEPVVTTATSASSTFFYVLSLILVFVFVLFSAYFVSKFLGKNFGSFGRSKTSGSVIGALPLDQNKRVLFLQLNDEVLVLGVTEQSISLLKEITEKEEVERIKREFSEDAKSGTLLNYQSQTLNVLQDKIKPMLRNLPDGKKGDNNK